jgi:hypothetical protein
MQVCVIKSMLVSFTIKVKKKDLKKHLKLIYVTKIK